MNGWTRVSTRSACGAPLDVYHLPGEDSWVEHARNFFEGRLEGLVPVPSATTARVYRATIGPERKLYYLKRYLHRDRRDPFKAFFRASRARRALINEARCTALGFHLPRSVCLIEGHRWGVTTYCALITEAITNAPNVQAWISKDELGVARSREGKRAFLRLLARELGDWHARGLYHGDLRSSNILCRRSRVGFTFYWLDNERNRGYRALPLRRRIHNLMQINYEPFPISISDRLWFWKSYLETARLPTRLEGRVLDRVIKKTRRRWRKRGWL